MFADQRPRVAEARLAGLPRIAAADATKVMIAELLAAEARKKVLKNEALA